VKLLLVRHAIAVERGTPGIPDDERPLTPGGARKFRLAARGLARLLRRPDAVLSSPLLRAWRTAEIVARAYGRLTPRELPALASGDDAALQAALAEFAGDACLLLVGHEPHLSALLARVLGSQAPERLAFRKGGVALLELPGGLDGGGRLVLYLTPRVLRTLA
jgi:phosphohistidine phosphatase